MTHNLDGVQTKLYLLQDGGEYSVTVYTYDKVNRLVKTVYPEGNTEETGYDALGMVVWEKDGRGNTVSYTRDLLGRVTNVTNALGQVTEYTYDTEGNKLSAKDGKGNTWRWEYDAENRVAREIDPGGITGNSYVAGRYETYEYNGDGTLNKVTDRNGVVKTYVYDILKRTTQETAAKGGETETRSYEYDGNGNLTGASNGSQYTVTRTYDEMNRTKTKNVPEIGTSKYEYDIQTEEGIAERSTDPSGNAVERVYDKLGRLIRVKDGAAESAAGYTYDAAGRIAQEVQETGMRTEYTYDGNNQVLTAKQYKAGEAEPSEETGYTYDNAGNVTQKTSSRTQAATYTYDALNRILTETVPGDSSSENAVEAQERKFTYTYDAAGNRMQEVRKEEGVEEESAYSYDNRNRLTGRTSPRGNETYGYDNNGNMTAITRSGGTQSFTYDFCNQMVSATDKTGAGGKEFSYDAEGRLVAENVVGETAERKYLYEGGNIILEKNTDGTETRNLYGHGLLLREEGKSTSAEIIAKHSLEIQYGEKKYYQGDGTGNVTGYLKGNGEEEARYEYYAFGQERKKEGETENPYQYAGARYDETVGMYYMEGNWYYPESGQYINGQRGNESLTRYVYRSNNPLNYADYSGFAPVRPTEEPEKAATNTGWRLQLGMIVENEGYTGMDNYATIILEPTVILDGYSQRIILEREIVRLNEEEEKRRKRENRQLQEERDLESFLADLDLGDIKAGGKYVPTRRLIVNIGERIENKVGGTFFNVPTDGYQIPADVILFNNNVGIPSNRESSLYLPGGGENFGMRALLMGYLQALTNDDLYLVEDKIVGKYCICRPKSAA